MQTLRRPLAACDDVGDQLIFKIGVAANRHSTIRDRSLFEQSGGNFREEDLMVADPAAIASAAYKFQTASPVPPSKIPGRRQCLLEFGLTPVFHIRSIDIDLTCNSD